MIKKEEGKMVKDCEKNVMEIREKDAVENKSCGEKWKELHMCIKGIELVDFEGRRQIVNELSQIILPLKKWKSLFVEEKGVIAEHTEKHKAFYNWNGKMVLSPEWREIIFLDDNLVKALSQEGKFSLFNLNGDKVLDGEYDVIDVIADLSGNKYLKVQSGKRKNGLYTMDVKPILACEEQYICYHDIAMGQDSFKVFKGREMKHVYLKYA